MSHVVEIKQQIKDLDALRLACEQLGLELVEGQKTYKWYGASMGDGSIPEGFTKDDLGHCEHAIRVKNAERNTYEIGVVTRRDGEPGYALLWDSWMGGYGLVDKVGREASKLTMEYSSQVAIKAARRAGFRLTRSVNEQGEVVLQGVR